VRTLATRPAQRHDPPDRPGDRRGEAGNPTSTHRPQRAADRRHGLRNPFRFAFRPGTNEVWAGDVGWNTWEEINRLPARPTAR
jgi:hypothetical protein